MTESSEAPTGPPRLVLITGLSGSGKSTAANALEDLGYYCVDNLPLPLLRTFLADPVAQVGTHQKRIAVVADVRAPGFAEAMPRILPQIDDRFEFLLLFMEASEAALLRRFSETRRAHPLGEGDRPVIEGIRRENELLSTVRGLADRIVDTSDWTVHNVREEIYREFTTTPDGEDRMLVSLVSFGFKHGVPAGCDLLFDARFLPNPYFLPDLREQTGRDPEVQEYLNGQDDFHEFLDKLEGLLLFLLPRYRQENRSYVTIAVGCTGGRHRSVATSERLHEHLRQSGFKVRLNHRDLER